MGSSRAEYTYDVVVQYIVGTTVKSRFFLAKSQFYDVQHISTLKQFCASQFLLETSSHFYGKSQIYRFLGGVAHLRLNFRSCYISDFFSTVYIPPKSQYFGRWHISDFLLGVRGEGGVRGGEGGVRGRKGGVRRGEGGVIGREGGVRGGGVREEE